MAASEGWSRDTGKSCPPGLLHAGGSGGQGDGKGREEPRWEMGGRCPALGQSLTRASSAEPRTPGMWGRGKAGPEGQPPLSGPEFDIM